MRKLILSIVIAAVSITAMAQGHSTDEQTINKQIDAFYSSWNDHNFQDMDKYTTVDCDWVNPIGMWWHGRKQVQFANQAFHNGLFKNTPLTKLSAKIKFVTKGVAIACVASKVGDYYPPDGLDRGTNKIADESDISMFVFVKKGNTWLLTSVAHVTVNEQAAKSNPVLKMQ